MSLEKFAQRHSSQGPGLPPKNIVLGILGVAILLIGFLIWQGHARNQSLAEEAYLKSKDYAIKHELAMAEDEIGKALEHKENSEYLKWQYIILASQDKHYEAEKSLKRALELEPNNADLHYTRAEFWYNQGENLSEALKNAKKAAELEPKNVDYILLCASILAVENKLPEAVEWTQKATKIDPQNLTAWSLLAGQYAALKQNNKVYQLQKKLTQTFPNNGDGWLQLGVTCEKLKMKEEAVAAYKKYMVLEPDFAEVAAYRVAELTGKPVEEKYRQLVEDALPVELANQQIIATAGINGTGGRFLIDTGAQVTAISTEFLKANHITVTQAEAIAHISGIGGSYEATVAYVDLKLGRFDFKNHRVVVIPEKYIGKTLSGIIGMDVLGKFDPRINHDKGLLILTSK